MKMFLSFYSLFICFTLISYALSNFLHKCKVSGDTYCAGFTPYIILLELIFESVVLKLINIRNLPSKNIWYQTVYFQ